MARHDHGDAGSDSRLERLELSREQSIKILMKDRQLPMGILVGIAVSGEVLAACQHVLALHGRHERESGLSHLLAVVPKARAPITGFDGLLWISSTGANYDPGAGWRQ